MGQIPIDTYQDTRTLVIWFKVDQGQPRIII